MLQEVMGGELDLFVTPFGGTVLARDQAHAMDPPEVAVHEAVSSLRLVGRTLGEPQMPVGVLLPRVRIEEGVLVLGRRLDLAPGAFQDVLAARDEISSMCHRPLVEFVGGHDTSSRTDRERANPQSNIEVFLATRGKLISDT